MQQKWQKNFGSFAFFLLSFSKHLLNCYSSKISTNPKVGKYLIETRLKTLFLYDFQLTKHLDSLIVHKQLDHH